MKNECLKINRDSWETLRAFRKAPFKRRYLEMQEWDEELGDLDLEQDISRL